jgi:hypothetical protein
MVGLVKESDETMEEDFATGVRDVALISAG